MLDRRRTTSLAFAALLAAALPSAPALAAGGAAHGGASPDAPATAPAEPVALSAPAAPASGAVGAPIATASASGITLNARSVALHKRRARLAGDAPARLRKVRVELRGRGGWTALKTVAVGEDGRFRALWRPRRAGAQQLRVVPAAVAEGAEQDAPEVEVTVYRAGVASWYGPGFYGGRTACGMRLRRRTLGVAHKTLRCGTQVQLLYRGRTLTVPVIDRGPFIAGRTWDLTKTTHSALGATAGLVTVGARPRRDLRPLRTPYLAPPIRRTR